MGMHEPTEGVHLARERVRAEVVRWEEAEVKQATRLHWRARVDLMGLTWRAVRYDDSDITYLRSAVKTGDDRAQED